MKSEIFAQAIANRNRIKFLYFFSEVVLEPYCISKDKKGQKIIYGRLSNSNEVRTFEYKNILNIKTLEKHRFSPVIPFHTVAI
ncbi:MAG: hypothetical protein ACM3O3_07170 [Syntrophothermus sp.]